MVTHPAARYAGPIWLARRPRRSTSSSGAGRTWGSWRRSVRCEQLPRGAEFRRVLVPMKLGPIGEEMVATAVALAKEREARVDALFVIVVPLDKPLDAPLLRPGGTGGGVARRGALLGEENGVRVEPDRPCARVDRPARSSIRRPRAASDLIVARLLAALAPPVASSSRRPSTTCSAARRARCSSSPSRRACSRTYSERMKLVVIGCGRVGAAVGTRSGRGRLGRDRGRRAGGGACAAGSALGGRLHRRSRDGRRDPSPGRRAGRRCGRRRDEGDNTNLVIGQVVEKR